ncbi:MAG: hypothetical protein WCA46_10525 [Actinocatenispora sp.]
MSPPSNPDHLDPRLLEELRSDRATLAERMHAPRWFVLGSGLAAAAYVVIPALPKDSSRNAVLLAAFCMSIALVGAHRRVTGIKASRFSVRDWALTAVGVVGVLALISISFGLSASGLRWWIVATALAAFVLVSACVALLSSSARTRIRHGL